jgi:hypothetical protein
MLLVDCEPFSQRSFPVNQKKRGAILLSLFFGATASVAGWRLAVLDPEGTVSGYNAL